MICDTNVMAQTEVVKTNTDNPDKSTNPIHPASGYVLDDQHQLESGDKVSFQMLEDKKPPVNLLVTDLSELDSSYIGRAAVAELKVMLEKDYYYHATVIIGFRRSQVFDSIYEKNLSSHHRWRPDRLGRGAASGRAWTIGLAPA
jgi:hypothetical protein